MTANPVQGKVTVSLDQGRSLHDEHLNFLVTMGKFGFLFLGERKRFCTVTHGKNYTIQNVNNNMSLLLLKLLNSRHM